MPQFDEVDVGSGGEQATQIHDATSALRTACGEDAANVSQCTDKQFNQMVALMNQSTAAMKKPTGDKPNEYMSQAAAGYHNIQQAAENQRKMYQDAPFAWGVNESQQFEIEDAVYEYLKEERIVVTQTAADKADDGHQNRLSQVSAETDANPEPVGRLEASNDQWYKSSLYESLKKKWAK